METNLKIFLCVGSSVLAGTILYFLKGIYASVMGLIITLLIWGLFAVWKRSQ